MAIRKKVSSKNNGSKSEPDATNQIKQHPTTEVRELKMTIEGANTMQTPIDLGPNKKAGRNKRKRETAKKNKAERERKEAEYTELLVKMSSMTVALEKDDVSVQGTKPKTDVSPKHMQNTSGNSQVLDFEVKPSPGKGLGLFATRPIPKGAEILREAPMIKGGLWLSIEASFKVLPKEKQERFLALHDYCNCKQSPCQESPLMRVWDVNSFETGLGVTMTSETDFQNNSSAVYEIASRINHACIPNTSRGFTKEGDIVFRAAHPIKAGEEITTYYIGCAGSAQARRQLLSSKYGFFCRCKACINNSMFSVIAFHRQNQSFEAPPTGIQLIGKPTATQIEAEKEVQAWFRAFNEQQLEVANAVTVVLQHTVLAGTCDREYRAYVVSRAMATTEKYLKENDKFGLGEDIIARYIARQTPKIKQSTELVYETVMQSIGEQVQKSM